MDFDGDELGERRRSRAGLPDGRGVRRRLPGRDARGGVTDRVPEDVRRRCRECQLLPSHLTGRAVQRMVGGRALRVPLRVDVGPGDLVRRFRPRVQHRQRPHHHKVEERAECRQLTGVSAHEGQCEGPRMLQRVDSSQYGVRWPLRQARAPTRYLRRRWSIIASISLRLLHVKIRPEHAWRRRTTSGASPRTPAHLRCGVDDIPGVSERRNSLASSPRFDACTGVAAARYPTSCGSGASVQRGGIG